MKHRSTFRCQDSPPLPPPWLGAHMSIGGGIPLAIQRARSAGANVMQIFVKNCNRWQGRILSDEEAAEFRRKRTRSGLLAVIAHSSYLVNLASPDATLWQRSIQATIDELERSSRLGLSHLVMHPGAHVGSGEAKGIERVALGLDQVFQGLPNCSVKIALETTAGQGTCLGYSFAHLRDILGSCRSRDRLAVCLDTCHVFAAGYDFRTSSGYRHMMEEFDRMIGMDRLQVVHVNDSKRELGSRVDRHEHIGKGCIGSSGFARLVHDPRLARVPKILETPKGKDLKADRINLGRLRRLYRNGTPLD